MPVVHKRTFRVRNYECDAYGHVNNANYVRYMQEAALDASAAVGYDEARYNELGHIWVIRETNIEYLRPLRFGDSVEVTTWVGDFRRVRSRRFYELRNAETGDMVAQGSTDWVYIDRASLASSAGAAGDGRRLHAGRRQRQVAPARSVPGSAARAVRRVHDAARGRVARHRHRPARQQRHLPQLHGRMRHSGGQSLRLVDDADAGESISPSSRGGSGSSIASKPRWTINWRSRPICRTSSAATRPATS